MFPKNSGFSPQIIHFFGGFFHYFHHPFLGYHYFPGADFEGGFSRLVKGHECHEKHQIHEIHILVSDLCLFMFIYVCPSFFLYIYIVYIFLMCFLTLRDLRMFFVSNHHLQLRLSQCGVG